MGRPSIIPPYSYPGLGEVAMPFRYIFRLAGTQVGRQAELAASIFGGVVGPVHDPIRDLTYFWTSTFDTGNTKWFSINFAASTDEHVKARFPMSKMLAINS